MVFPWQDDVPVLQEGDPAWQPKVRVRPLVDLVGKGSEDDEAEDEALPGVQLLQGLCGAVEGVPGGPQGCYTGWGPPHPALHSCWDRIALRLPSAPPSLGLPFL